MARKGEDDREDGSEIETSYEAVSEIQRRFVVSEDKAMIDRAVVDPVPKAQCLAGPISLQSSLPYGQFSAIYSIAQSKSEALTASKDEQ